jgi:hypothetical protein
MPPRKPTIHPNSEATTGPMGTQPAERATNMPTQVQPAMPAAGGKAKAAHPPQEPAEPSRTEAVRAAKARITRRNSLRTQRKALKD